MRLYKPKYKDKNGERKTLSKWWLELRDHKGKTRRFAGYSDKAATQSLGKQIERLIVVRSIGEQPGAELNNWLSPRAVIFRHGPTFQATRLTHT